MFLTIIFVFCGVFYLWQKWNFSFWRRNGVPGPSPSIFGGNLGRAITQRIHIGMLADSWYRKFPNVPYIGYYKSFKPAIMVRDVELLKNILITDFTSFSANDLPTNDDPNDVTSITPFLQKDEKKWKLGRAVLSPMFTSARLKAIFPRIQRSCDKLIQHINQQDSVTDIESKTICAEYTTESVASCLYSVEANCFKDPNCEFRRMSKKLFKPSFQVGLRFGASFFLPFILNLPFLTYLIPRDLEDWAKKMAIENIEIRNKQQLKYDDMLQTLLSAQEKFKISHNDIAGHAFAFFIDGYETSSTTMSFALWHLARNPDIQERLYEEIERVITKYDNTFSYEAINEMEYLNLIFNETTRLNTVGLTMQRQCTKPYELPKLPGQKEPIVLQPGTPVLIPVYAIHHDPEYYPDPDLFNPLRFREEECQKRPKCSFLPFGEGPRICVGRKFGELQTKLGVASVVRNYIITESPDCKPFDLDPRSILLMQSRNGLLLRFQKRN